jgi:Xaa-Pro aminopeptidase
MIKTPVESFEIRLQDVRRLLPIQEVDALFITNPTNRRWLSGFTGSYGRILITDRQAILATDSRYWEQVRVQAPGFELFKDLRQLEDTVQLLKLAAAKRIGFETHHVSVAEFDQLEGIDGITWVPLDQPVEPLRQVKTASEIAAIRAAATITDHAMSLVPQIAVAGISERALAWELEKTMREGGADGLAFDPIVAFGSNSALPHHQPSDRILQLGDIILVDMGAELNGYKSDMTRTFFLGKPAEERFFTIFNLVHSALRETVENLRPGVNSQEAHQMAIDVIDNGGFRKHFGHGLGHGVGLDIHEAPILSVARSLAELSPGMAITVEPGIYLPGWGGVRIEDLILVTNTGNEPLSHYPKNPLIHSHPIP